jgi:hypothetical protein
MLANCVLTGSGLLSLQLSGTASAAEDDYTLATDVPPDYVHVAALPAELVQASEPDGGVDTYLQVGAVVGGDREEEEDETFSDWGSRRM